MFILLFLMFILWVLKESVLEIRKHSTKTIDVVKFLLWSPILFVIFSVLTIMVPIGKIWKLIVSTILKFKIGDEYCDVVRGTDVFMASDTWKNSLIKPFMVIEYNKSLAKKEFFDYMKDMAERCRSENKVDKRFFATFHKFMGYLFYRNVKCHTSDFIRKLPVTNKDLDKKELISLIKSCFYKPMPLNGAALWDMYVGTQPLTGWKSNPEPNVEYYPLLFRMHHGIVDGLTLAKMLINIFGDDDNIKVAGQSIYGKFEQKESLIEKLIKTISTYFRVCVMFVSAAYIFLLLKGHDSNDLHGKPFEGDAVIQCGTDDDRNYFRKVKKIKKIHSKICFSEILIAAFGASLCEYYKKYYATCPEYVTMALPVITDLGEIEKILSGRLGTNETTPTNNFVFLQLRLPIDISKNKQYDKNAPLTSRLNIIKDITEVLKNSIECQFSYIYVYHMLGSLPIWFARQFGKSVHNTTVGSFLPGPTKLSYHDNAFKVSDCMFWVPHIMQLGVGITTLTYDDHLCVGVNCTGQITEQSHIDEIVHNIYKYIDLLEEEMDRM